jgi:hypothetical protein
MRYIDYLPLIVLFTLLAATPALAQQGSPTLSPPSTAPESGTPTASAAKDVAIHFPQPGQALQGVVLITGNTAIPAFLGAELAFAYAHDPTQTWFILQSMEQPVSEGVLAQWDTSAITDGNYDLRLTVFLENDQKVEVSVAGLRIRNYTPIETNTPTPLTPTPSLAPGLITPRATETPTPILPTSSPTPLPTNAAVLTPQDVSLSLGKGALTVAGLFALLGIYQTLKKMRERE